MENELFEKTAVPKAYMTLAIPVVLSMIVSLVYNMVDTFFIARTGNTNLIAGVSICAPVFTMMIAMGDIFGLGGSSAISRLFGKQKFQDVRRISAFCYYAALISGVCITALLLIFQTPILHLLGADAQTYEYARSYYVYIALGAPFVIVSFTPSNQLRTEGLVKESMIGAMMGSVVNMILDPLFIFTFGFGAAGAAIATVIGNVCAVVYFTWILARKTKHLSVLPGEMHVSKAELAGIMAIGIPASITNMMQSLGIAMTNRFLLPYGNDKIAILGIVMKINMIAVLVMVGFAFGGQPLIGYNYGAHNKARLKKILKFAYGFECSLGLGLTLILSAAAPWLLRLFLKDEVLIASGITMLRIQLVSMVCVGIVLVTTVTFQSAGKAAGAFVLSAFRQGVLLALALVVGTRLLGYQGVLWAQPAADLCTAITGICIMYGGFFKEINSEN